MHVVRRHWGHTTLTIVMAGTLIVSLLAVGLSANAAAEPSFVDPTAILTNRTNIRPGSLDYIGPFAALKAGTDADHSITIGDESNVQDSVVVDTAKGKVALGDMVILAHGATVKGNSAIGVSGSCPGGAAHCPAFVGFNAEVDGAIVQTDGMVQTLSRVAPGVTIPSGRKTLPGTNIASNAEVMAKTAAVVEADRAFMDGVIEVNVAFAREYVKLAQEDASNVMGINYDPGNSPFNPKRDLPKLAGKETRDPAFRNRIIGDVSLTDTEAALNRVIGSQVSLRADEGEPFTVGSVAAMGNNTTFHALEHTNLHLGANGSYGAHSLIHGGPTPYGDATISGDNLRLGNGAVLFRSRVGKNVTIGDRSLVQESDLPDGTTVPARTVIIGGQKVGMVEWDIAADDSGQAPSAPTGTPQPLPPPPPPTSMPTNFIRRLGDG
jgi:carbonic anhydrase/acetyltransferase-like protein (isoleucine patch superfamily)